MDRRLRGQRDGVARIWTTTGTLIMELRGHTGPIWRGTWSRDGERVITASFDRTAQVWLTDPEALVEQVDKRLESYMPSSL